MNVKKTFEKYFSLTFTNHILAIINFISFVMICFISFALDAISPFNKINIILVGVFIFTTLAFLAINKIKPRLSIFTICVIGTIACMLISFAVNGFNSFPKTPLLMCVLSLFVYLWFDANKKLLNFYLFGLLIASYLFMITFFVFEFSSIIHPNFSIRIGSSLGNQNDVARHLVFAFAINCYYIYSFKNKLLISLSSILSVILFYFVLLTGSISNLLLLTVVFVIFVTVISKKKARPFIIIASIAFVIILVFLVFTIPALSSIKNRILSIVSSLFGIGDYRIDSSTTGRFSAALYGFRLFLDSPLFGNGFNSVVENYKIMAHNNIAEIGADYGLFALLFEEVMIVYPLFARRDCNKKASIFVILICIYIFLVQFFLVVFNSKIESILLPLVFVLSNNDKFPKLFYTKTIEQNYYYEVSI